MALNVQNGRTSAPGHRRSRTTVSMVAEHAGVSIQTVSNAINAPHLLREQTLQRVLASIDELQYTPNHAARSLRTQSAGMIGCRLLPSARRGSGAVLDRFLYALSDAARTAGDGLVCHAASTDEDEIAIFDVLVRRHAVDGFVISGTHYHDPRPDWLVGHHVPFVSFGRPWGGDVTGHCWVDIDGAAGTDAATTHLLEQGHERIAFLGWPAPNGVGEDREAGWRRAMRRHRRGVRGLSATCGDSVEAGAEAAQRLLASSGAPTAFVCVSDAVALGAMRAVEDAGHRVGPDVGVVGFDDSASADLVRPGLTSVHQPIEQAAEHLVRMLRAHIGGTAPDEQLLLAPSLVVRGSSVRG